jgi:hypothetical protein
VDGLTRRCASRHVDHSWPELIETRVLIMASPPLKKLAESPRHTKRGRARLHRPSDATRAQLVRNGVRRRSPPGQGALWYRTRERCSGRARLVPLALPVLEIGCASFCAVAGW